MSLCTGLAFLALLAALARPAPASAAGTPCWKALLNDWYDGRIDRTYARHCYQDALRHLPADVQTYSSARDDILRALQGAIAKQKKAGHQVGPNSPIVPPTTGTKSGGGGGGGGGGSTKPGGTKSGPRATTQTTGRRPEKGLTGLADQLNPGSASSLPVPLLVLGGLALVLVAAGAAGLVAKRLQARRPRP